MNVNKVAFIFLLASHALLSIDSKFEHPLRIEPASIYTKLRLDGAIAENHQLDTYQKDKNFSFEGEFKFLEYFSIKLNGGKTWYKTTDTQPISQWDRWNVAVKFAKESGSRDSRVVFGGGVRLFNKQIGEHPRAYVAPELYLIKPHISFGFGTSGFEVQLEGAFQTETNTKFKEGPKEEFRRYYQFGLSISQKLTESIRVFIETDYKEPYNKKVDLNTRAWYWYPGLSLSPYESGRIAISLQFPVSKQDYLYERGLKISYFHFFE